MSQIIKSNILKESYELISTDCGLKIACYYMPKYNGMHAVFATNFGSVDRNYILNGEKHSIPAGIAHFLEHKMFENEDGDAFEKFSKTGANANAFTSFDKTCYIFSATDNIDESLDILLSFVTKPYFTKETVAKEQGIIGQEIKMYDDSANWRMLFGVLEGLFVNHPVKDDIAGTVESIGEITPDMLYDCCKAFYSPSQMILSVAGNVSADRIKAACDRAGFINEVADVKKISVDEPENICYSEKSINMAVSIPMVAIGFKENIATTIENEILGDIIMEVLTGSTSELFNRLYDENIVNGTFEGEIFSGDGYYASIISGETQSPEKLIDEIEAAIADLKRNGISQEQFQTSKNAMYGSMIVDFENVEEVATNIVNNYFKGYSIYDPLEVLSGITLEQVNRQLSTMFNQELRTIFKVLPLEK